MKQKGAYYRHSLPYILGEEMHVMSIGKNGITSGVIEEIRRQLEEKKEVKIRLLRSVRVEKNRFELARDLEEKTGGMVKDLRGNVVVLVRKK